MVEYVYSKPKKSHLKLIILIAVIVTIVISISLYYYLFSEDFDISTITQTGCYESMVDACSNCFEINDFRFDIWSVSGEKIDSDLIQCSNKHFDTGWIEGQDCTGNTIEDCLLYVA